MLPQTILRHHPGITLSDVGVWKEKRAVPPFGTPLTMTARLVANIQNRLFRGVKLKGSKAAMRRMFNVIGFPLVQLGF
jgi:hypothetical protein